MTAVQPFKFSIPDADIADLRARLARARLPDSPPLDDAWAPGTPPSFVRDLIDHWATKFDFAKFQSDLNAHPQFVADVRGTRVHCIRAPAKRNPNAPVLLVLHGWPGSIAEFLDIIPLLTDPEDPEDAFEVVATGLPGFGLSWKEGQPRMGIAEMTAVLADFMAALGIGKFFVFGEDWGAAIAARLAAEHPDRILGLHLAYLYLSDPNPAIGDTAEEKRMKDAVAKWSFDGIGYRQIQQTKPQTLAVGLTDSPAGLAAWIGEKFHAWVDHGGDLWGTVSKDRVLANISLYWFTGAVGSTFWPYYARHHGQWPLPVGCTIGVPTGHAEYVNEIFRTPRKVAETTYTNIVRWTVMERGGHFGAMERPKELAMELAAFARDVRGAK
ncbi:Alpha/Beta hydrolase protein [Hyaloraphidium curvatum]|nr:Alpha/Beta hydrolase protein [Hyaloraphidium curvatum]